MQFDPENYPVADYKFTATSTLGIIAREYEVTQLVQLLQTMKQDSPMYPLLMQSIIDNMNLSNREELIAAMQQASQPNPQAQQMAMLAQQAQIELQQSQTAALQGQAAESQARAGKLAVESQIAPQELQIDLVNAVTKNLKEGDQEDKEFERRLKVADRLLKKREMEAKTQNANDANGTQQPVQPSERRVQGAGPTTQGLENTIRRIRGEA
jgi:formaldehyde-activating enzyme involved in methanogenesis